MDLVDLQQIREQVVGKSKAHQQRIKGMFEKRAKVDNFQVGDWVLKWDTVRKDKGKHGKFESLWIVPFVIAQVQKNNTFKLQNMEGEEVFDGPVNGHFLKQIGRASCRERVSSVV